jgi:HAD superfamily hydrolase (TIGR01549 family)
MPPRPAVTFDLWHTLVYLEPEAETSYMSRQIQAATRVLKASPIAPGVTPAPESELAAAFKLEYRRAVRAASEGRSVTPAEQLSAAARATGRLPRPAAYIAELDTIIAAAPFRRDPGALEVLAQLRAEGYALGIVSNTVGEPGRLLRPMLRRFGLDPAVQCFVFSDEHPWSKPSPSIFLAALSELGSAAPMAVHVGDSWSDIEGARRAGLRGSILYTGLQDYAEKYRELFLPPGSERPAADKVAQQLPEVVPIVRELLPVASGRPTAG